MQEGFPFKKKITTRLNSVPNGGDGRYLWTINRFDKSVTIVDLATFTTQATISIPAINDWSNGNYVPANKSLYIHNSGGHTIIDLDPLSATFCTITSTGTQFPTTNSGNQVNYYEPLDVFIGSGNGFLARPRLNPSASYTLTYGSKATTFGMSHTSGWMTKGSVNPLGVFGWWNVHTNRHIGVGGFGSVILPIVNQRIYMDGYEFDFDGNQVRGPLVAAGAQAAFIYGFCPRSKCFVGGGGAIGSGWRLNVISFDTYRSIGNTPYISSVGAPASSGYQYRDVIYNPFTGFVFCKPTFYNFSLTDIHYYDITKPLATMYQGSVSVGGERAAGISPYQNNTMGFNMLKNDEYSY
jgi:hypothetical protein